VTRASSSISHYDRLVYKNTLANLLGFGIGAAISLVTGPLLFRVIGPTQYGLIAVFQLALVIAPVFDYGVSLVLNREVASRSDGHDGERIEAGVALKTAMGSLELLIVGIAIILAVVVIGASGWLATDWFKVTPEEAADARTCLMIGAASLCIQRVRVFGMAVLTGRQRQVELNIWTTTVSFFRMVLGLAAVFFLSPTAICYLLVQLLLSIAEASLFHMKAWHGIGARNDEPYFSLPYIRSVSKPLMANWGAVVAATLVGSADKIVLSGSMDIKSYGQYVLIATAINSLSSLVGTPVSAFLPKLTVSVVAGDRQNLSATFTLFSTIAAALCIPALVGVAGYGDDVIRLLLGSTPPAAGLWLVLVLLAGGGVFSALNRVVHAFQIAHNRPDMALKFNVMSAPFYLAACWYGAYQWGAIGAAGMWLAYNATYLMLFLVATEKSLGMGSTGRWLLSHLVAPGALSLALFAMVKQLDVFGLYVGFLFFAIAGTVSTLLCLLMNPELKRLVPVIVSRLTIWIKHATAGS
jgi:O-antigen/teichoic acid export membrane protein